MRKVSARNKAALLLPPRVASELLPADVTSVMGDLVWSQLLLTGDGAGRTLEDLAILESHCQEVSFTGMRLERARVRDVVFDHCDLSAVRFNDAGLTRVAFRNCRLSGAQFPDAQLRDVQFIGCKLDDANFRMVDAERLRITDCLLRDADFHGSRLTGLRCYDSELTGVEFGQSSVRDVRLNGSVVDGIKGADALKGVVIDSAQVIPFALSIMATMKVDVDDTRPD